jgi:hypothetical protein
MLRLSNKRLTVICIVLAIALCVSIIEGVVIHIENVNLKNEQVRQMSSEWHEISELCRDVDNYIKSNCVDGIKYQLLVNKICYHFQLTAAADDLNINMSNLLILSYDPLFSNLVNEKETVNKEKAIKLLKDMNSSLAEISKSIDEMNDGEKRKLMDQSSQVYKKVSARVQDFSLKYQKLADNYFKGL